MKYIGIDLHSDNSFVAVIDEEDNLVYRKGPMQGQVSHSNVLLECET